MAKEDPDIAASFDAVKANGHTMTEILSASTD